MHAAITTSPIDPAAMLATVGAPADGAVLLFLGTVRDHNDDRAVTGMRYEAYGAMAERVLQDIAAEAAARLGTDRITVVHRVGELAIGDVSVAIAASAPHRAASFDAARFVIEQIKLRLPVWKHEHYTDGAALWLDGVVPPAAEGARP